MHKKLGVAGNRIIRQKYQTDNVNSPVTCPTYVTLHLTGSLFLKWVNVSTSVCEWQWCTITQLNPVTEQKTHAYKIILSLWCTNWQPRTRFIGCASTIEVLRSILCEVSIGSAHTAEDRSGQNIAIGLARANVHRNAQNISFEIFRVNVQRSGQRISIRIVCANVHRSGQNIAIGLTRANVHRNGQNISFEIFRANVQRSGQSISIRIVCPNVHRSGQNIAKHEHGRM